MSVVRIFQMLCGLNCERAMIHEYPMKGTVVVLVPTEFMTLVKVWLRSELPIGIAWEVRRLPWWRCWFTNYIVRVHQ
jgi:hypothetical protein